MKICGGGPARLTQPPSNRGHYPRLLRKSVVFNVLIAVKLADNSSSFAGDRNFVKIAQT